MSLGPIFMKTPAAHFELHANMVGHLREIMTVFLVYGIWAWLSVFFSPLFMIITYIFHSKCLIGKKNCYRTGRRQLDFYSYSCQIHPWNKYLWRGKHALQVSYSPQDNLETRKWFAVLYTFARKAAFSCFMQKCRKNIAAMIEWKNNKGIEERSECWR